MREGKNPIPLMHIEVVLKRVDVQRMNKRSLRTFNYAYSGFLDPKRKRRYSGATTLPRGRYWTVCADDSGEDHGTLRAELGRYYEPEKVGPILVAELSLASDSDRAAFAAAEYDTTKGARTLDMMFPPSNVNTLPFMVAGWPRWFVPLRVERRTLENVFDLRKPDVAQWFAQHSHYLSRLGPPAPSSDFLKLLPWLLDQSVGGGRVCQAVGMWLRDREARALIYPSARMDASVRVEAGSVTDWIGWNLVDYGASGEHPDRNHTVSMRDDAVNEREPLAKVKKETLTVDNSCEFAISCGVGRLAGSWKVQGMLRAQVARIEDGLRRYREKRASQKTPDGKEVVLDILRDGLGAIARGKELDADPSKMDANRKKET
jgi:hypothetical protein